MEENEWVETGMTKSEYDKYIFSSVTTSAYSLSSAHSAVMGLTQELSAGSEPEVTAAFKRGFQRYS